VKKPCNCGGKFRTQAAQPQNFCTQVTIGLPVVLRQTGDQLSLSTYLGGGWVNLEEGIRANSCVAESTGLRLANAVLAAIRQVNQGGRSASLGASLGRRMPLTVMRDTLWRATVLCADCAGSGCQTCGLTGVGP
jgi:hypothetical protein